MSEQTIFSAAQDLEALYVDLGRIKDLLSIVLESIFYKKGEMTDYAMQYASLLEAALSKVHAHEKEVLEIADILYDIRKSQKEQRL